MIQTGFERRVKVQQVIESQLPEFLRSESPKSIDFLKQYYISQEHQGGATDIVENLDQYLKFDNLTPEVVTGYTSLTVGISSTADRVEVSTTKGFPDEYGLFKIGDEIITYTGKTATSFTGCIRGFSGISSYRSSLDPEELVFSDTSEQVHAKGSTVQNLSALFLKEFYKKLKYSFAPGLEDVDFVDDLDVNNFVKEIRSLYEAKGTEDSFKILFKVLYGVDPKIIDLEDYLIKPSGAKFTRREEVVVERVSGDPNKLVGQTIRKSSDSSTKASVSEVETFTRSGISTYYRLGLFVGFDDRDLIEGTFKVQPSTKVSNAVSIGASVVTVDSTVGFAQTGKIISGRNTIEYTDKTVNQFLGCSGIGTAISPSTELRIDEVYIGYEDGDTSKKVEVRIGGVLSKFKATNDILLSNEGQKIFVKNIGERIKNPELNKTDKQIFANSWIYNTSCRFDVESITGSTVQLKSEIDESSLKVGDTVDILNGSTETVLHANAVVSTITTSNKQITLDNIAGFTANSTTIYTIRRKLETATSSGTPLFYGDNTVTTDIQNVYTDETYAYVASNSLPSYQISETALSATLASATGSALQGFNPSTQKYSIISFATPVPFVTGDEVVYKASSDTLVGLPEGVYFVKVLTASNQIKLFASRSLIEGGSSLEFTSASGAGTHKFVLANQKSETIYPQQLLKKFPIVRNIKDGKGTPTIPGSTGMLVNGTEIVNYKSNDKIYSGPIKNVRLYNSGKNYDVINPPTIEIGSPGAAYTTALVRPIVRGSVTDVKIDPQDFDLVDVTSITIDGGNGSGAVLQPILETRYREIEFDARLISGGGGIDTSDDTITFEKPHNLRNGDAIVYSRNGNNAIGIGTFGGSNTHQDKALASGSVYYAQIVNTTTIKLYETLENYSSGISTVGFTTTSQGIHKFRLFDGKKTISSIKVINSGSGYENRQLKVKSDNISSVYDSVTFKNHGFSDGDKILYTTDNTAVTGLSTSVQYQVLKIDDHSFRLANAGVGGTNTTDYTKKQHVNITGVGTGIQNFAYPPISITVNAEFDGVSGVITATPSVRGEIVDLYLYETGTGYGSNILNFHKKPDIKIKNGKNAELKPLISGGKVVSVQITNPGSEYSSAPDLKVEGEGVGAKLRAIVSGGKITNVVVLVGGAGYVQNNTSINVTSAGSGCVVDVEVRDLTCNAHTRFGDEILVETEEKLGYGLVGYSTAIGADTFGDNGGVHSPIIGWAYDGNPIYGGYGYSDPSDTNTTAKILESGYELATAEVSDRPSGFAAGFFVEDYKFTDSGDLDEHNGRYAKTPEYPNGVYAYHATITNDGKNSKFPFFIGGSYSSVPVTQNIDQNFDFNSSDLRRNTLPYVASDKFATNDFISEPNEVLVQSAIIDSITRGSVDGFKINNSGTDYRVLETATFDNSDTSGGGLSAYVSRVTGKSIVDVTTTVQSYQNAVLVWNRSGGVTVNVDPSHGYFDNDQIAVSGLSTFISGLTKSHKIGVSSERTRLSVQVASNSTVGFVTDIFVNRVVNSISVGSTLGIGTETLSVLGTYPDKKVVRVLRGIVGAAHTATTDVFVSPSKFTLPVNVPYFDSAVNNKVFFNSIQSVGIGTTTGASSSKGYFIGGQHYTISVPTQGIYLPNHPFKTGEQVTFERVAGSQGFTVSNTNTSATYGIPQSGNTETLFVVKKTDDVIGLCTQVGLTTNTGGLYFRNITSNADSRDYRYSLTSNKTQVTAKVEKIRAKVAVSTAHGLINGDIVNLSVNSEQSVGIGTSVSVYLKYDSANDKLLVNPIGFTSTAVDTSTNRLTLTEHGLTTGDKVFYDSDLIISGLTTGSYFVYKIDDNTINLTNTRFDAVSNPPTVVSFGSTGGSSQELSAINPRLNVVRDNNLVFNVNDSSLSGYNFKLYYDRDFKNELISIGSSTTFSTVGVGTVGIANTVTASTVTLNFSTDLPSKVYYQLDKAGYISTADTEVTNYSEINFIDSTYSGTYGITGVGETVFTVSLDSVPEDLDYNQESTSVLKYSTSSPRALGGIDEMKITFGGSSYKKLPKFVSIASTAGINADIIPISTTLGRINQVTIQDAGFDFSADKTLNPEVYISPNVTVVDRNTISRITITSGGSGYTSPPELVLVNPDTGSPYDNGSLTAKIGGSSIIDVEVLDVPKGLSDTESKVFSVNNSNGVGVNSVFSSPAGVVTCVLATPTLGFTADTAPFAVNDFVYAENISLASTTGTGFNSQDYSYNFFKVTAYRNTNPAEVEFDISPYATNAGVAQTDGQSTFATLVNKNNYPTFTVEQSPLEFIVGESLFIKSGNTYTEVDLIITNNLNDAIKVYGTYELSENDVILGKNSGTLATINKIDENTGVFEVDYSLETDNGWSNDTGKLNEDFQVVADNDYYQNLSYSIKSPIEFENWINPVNRVIHSSGLKNFADTGITSEGKISAASTSANSSALIDIINLNANGTTMRVDAINFFDFGIDIDTSNNKSKFIKFQNKRLSDYIECRTNRVLTIDNFNNQFSNQENANTTLYRDIDKFIANDGYSRYLVQMIKPNSKDLQATELIVVNTNDDNLITVEKASIHNTKDDLANIEAFKDAFDNVSLRLTPDDPYNDDIDVKFIKNNFNSTLTGIGTQSIGFVNLIGNNVSVGVGSTGLVFEGSSTGTESLFANIELLDTVTKDKTVVDMFVDHDGTDTYRSDFFFDNSKFGTSSKFIGTFTSNITSGVLKLNFENTESNNVLVRSRIVGFNTIGAGIGTHIFKASGQPDSSVREGRLETKFSTFSGTGISTVLTYDKSDVTTVKSTAKVSYGNTSALHQVLFNHNDTNAFTMQYPHLSIGSTMGIGTFGADINGSNFVLIFHPDANISDDITVQIYSEIIQTEKDLNNVPATLTYGSANEQLKTAEFNSINGDRTNKVDFDVKHNRVPIFEKEFNPGISTVVNLGTGVFTIADHFFSDREKLTYTPRSTFIGGAHTSMVMSDGNILPSTVYAIKTNNNEFKLATSKTGAAVTFNSAGSGNGHTLEMVKKLEKSLITIDGVSRSPLAFTSINYTLNNNGGSISVGATYFGISGISSILPGDVLKVDDEFVKVNAVGLGTTTIGPITGTGSFNVVKTERGFVGTLATTHTDGSTIRVFQGSYNMTRSKIHFTEAPRGNTQELVDNSNIPYHKSTFNGRVYLRNDYATNQIYDDITRQFTGIGATYRLTVGGANTTGIETGSGLVFINNMFQTPTTDNNAGGNYSFTEDGSVSNVVFTGITDSNDDLVISDTDVNKNQLPRGGMIVSLGSTQGLGIAPLVGASVTAFVSGGVIQSIGAGATDILGSGYRGSVAIGITDPNHNGSAAAVTVTVGAGGSLAFNVTNGGSGYSYNPTINIPSPSYENLPITGVSRLGLGATTDTGSGLLLNVEVGAAITAVGIGSTLFEVKNFKIVRNGYGFRIGDKFKAVGLVTAKGLPAMVNEPEFEVLNIFNDKFAAWQFGELDFIDSISDLIDGSRTRFPLNYKGELLSFEVDKNNIDSSAIDLEAVLLIYVNGVIQQPNVHYQFVGGTSIVFTTAPTSNDNIDIFFYRGTRGTDSVSVDVNATVETGDILQMQKTNTSLAQDPRTVYNINNSDKVETNIYAGLGIDDTNFKPLSWIKKKVDQRLGGELVHKSRDSIEGQVYPTARVIGDISASATEIFVDDAQFFNYEENESSINITSVDGLLVNTSTEHVSAAVTAVVSSTGTISSLDVTEGGAGYSGSATVKISAPKAIGVGVGTTATGTVAIVNDFINSASVTNAGFGYTRTAPPQVLVSTPTLSVESLTGITAVAGFAATITGIATAVGTNGNSLALAFSFTASSTAGLQEGYPIFVKNTSVGDGVRSINGSDNSIVAIGTTFLDNVYIINDLHTTATTGVATCNILSTTTHTGLTTTGSLTDPRGILSWGRLSGFTRASSPIAIGVTGLRVDAGLSTFPTIQRRGFGLRDNGSLRKDLG